MRKFVDAKGVEWSVWRTVPAPDSPLAPYYPGGWLTFDCGGDTLRRLSPAPSGWETAAETRLELMCRVAEEVPRHTGERPKLQRPTPASDAPAVSPEPGEDAARPIDDQDERRTPS